MGISQHVSCIPFTEKHADIRHRLWDTVTVRMHTNGIETITPSVRMRVARFETQMVEEPSFVLSSDVKSPAKPT